LAAGGSTALREPQAEAARIKAAWTTTTLYDVKGARVGEPGDAVRPATGKYLRRKVPAR
jgi:hypothetical protein